MKKVYLAGPMSGITDHNFPAFDEAAGFLRGHGLEVISPADLTRDAGMGGNFDGSISEERYAFCMRQDIEALLTVDSIVCLPGWKNSKGARFEVHLGQLLGLTVVEYPYSVVVKEKITTSCP